MGIITLAFLKTIFRKEAQEENEVTGDLENKDEYDKRFKKSSHNSDRNSNKIPQL